MKFKMEFRIENFTSDSSLRQLENVKWIFFDLDDTIWDFAANSEVSLELLYSAEERLRELFATFEDFSRAYHALNSELWRRYHHAEISRDFLLNERFRGILADALASSGLKVDYDIKEYADRLNEQYLKTLGKQTAVVDGAREVLAELSKRYLIGVLSNGFREVQYDKLRNTGLDRYVQRTVLSDEIGIQKPDRRIFDFALDATGATATTVLMVGDNPETDVAGARSAGWRAIHFDRSKEESAESKLSELTEESAESGFPSRIRDLRELLTYL